MISLHSIQLDLIQSDSMNDFGLEMELEMELEMDGCTRIGIGREKRKKASRDGNFTLRRSGRP